MTAAQTKIQRNVRTGLDLSPPWDLRQVWRAGDAHYHSRHQPRSVPRALGLTLLATLTEPKLLNGGV